jgi:hypothetical protein
MWGAMGVTVSARRLLFMVGRQPRGARLAGKLGDVAVNSVSSGAISSQRSRVFGTRLSTSVCERGPEPDEESDMDDQVKWNEEEWD